MGAGATIGGVILLAIGLIMVAGGGGAFIMSMMNSGFSSSSPAMIGGIVLFWIGMAPTVIGIRLIARSGRIEDLEDEVHNIKRYLDEEIKRKSNKEQDNKPDVDSDKNENL